MRVLVHIATRARGFDWLKAWQGMSTLENTRFLISLDDDDGQPVPEWVNDSCKIVRGQPAGKVAAMNRGISGEDWDVLIVGSDDMRPMIAGYDSDLSEHLEATFPDLDGCLWTPTEDAVGHIRQGGKIHRNGDAAYLKGWICMLPIMGRTYYDRFGYVYHSAYKYFWCDNEQTDVARRLGKISYVDAQYFKHLHPAWDKAGESDGLYEKANPFFPQDMATYNKRKAHGFPLT